MQPAASLARSFPWLAAARSTGAAPFRFPAPIARTALLVFAAYYLGSQLGLVLRFPPATPSVLWPPNAILTATLLLTPPRLWGLYLLAALPAHLLAQLGADWPWSLVLALFLTNCSEALVGAIVVRSLSDAPARFDTLRRVVAFLLGAVLLGPFVSSFLDAAVVTWLRGEAYGAVWTTRFASNVLTELALVPVIVTVIAKRARWIRSASPGRRAEAALLLLGLLAAGIVVFTPLPGASGMGAASIWASRMLFGPLLFWAAVRFGPGGASLSFLTIVLLAIWGGTSGQEQFSTLPAREGLLALQIYMTLLATPILCLAALIEERRSAQEALAERLRFEELLSRLSGAFVQPPSDQMPLAFQTWAHRLGEFMEVDRVMLLEPAGDTGDLAVACSWTTPGFDAAPTLLAADDHPLLTGSLRAGQACLFSRLDDLGDETQRDRMAFRRSGTLSAIAIPLVAGSRVLGALAFATLRREKTWAPELAAPLQMIGEVFAHALARRQTEDALRASEMDAQRSREELAHLLRVSTMGEMTSSLAHELNQPLTAILANAQAARHLLSAARPDIAELREIVADMIEEDKRAGDVIRRLRELLKKGHRESVLLDLNKLVRGVARLMGSDALIRRVRVNLELHPDPLMVRADRVQVQQVVLNLMMNAMEAMEEPGPDRTLVVRTTVTAAQTVAVEVEDSGKGVREGAPDLVFQPFYTTKATGMGMGLSIARSIADAHGGAVWFTNNPSAGATFHFRLPLAPNPPAPPA